MAFYQQTILHVGEMASQPLTEKLETMSDFSCYPARILPAPT